MLLAIKTKTIFQLMILTICIFFLSQQNTLSQESSESTPSPYHFGVLLGYGGLLEGSKLAESFNSKDFISGETVGFEFEYKLPNTNSYLQLLTEKKTLNFKSNLGNNFQSLDFTTIGIKMHPRLINNLYFTVGAGLMTGRNIESQFIMSFNLGYDILKSKNTTTFLQVGLYTTDIKENFVSIRLGIKINL